MEKRLPSRVSEGQWNILIDFLEQHPNLARARGYNNSAHGRAESFRLWQEVANSLNAEGSGTTKSPKEWSVYVSNYKSKLKKIVADINTDCSSTGGGPPRLSAKLADWDTRFLALLGPGFGQAEPRVLVQPFPNEQPSTSAQTPQMCEVGDIIQTSEEAVPVEIEEELLVLPSEIPNNDNRPLLPRQRRQKRVRTRPLAPLDEARRILSQVEMQRAAADAASAEGLQNIGLNLGRLANTAEQYFQYIVSLRPA
ncbi:uncharacterized protein LOC121732681 [Aricia agestis]|uniref:uncharacterized protein LOC121732681 n=1 Tax=Aricia agestis TaxID=91739 RepID=UPI001C205082|nr:uncharacterized protein LOC121732681 [Aricia agestis]